MDQEQDIRATIYETINKISFGRLINVIRVWNSQYSSSGLNFSILLRVFTESPTKRFPYGIIFWYSFSVDQP